MIFTIFLGFLMSANAFSAYMMWRNGATHELFMEVLDQMYIAANTDAGAGRDWRWRTETYDKCSYTRVLWMFWLPLEPKYYWDNLDFLDHTKRQLIKEQTDAKNIATKA